MDLFDQFVAFGFIEGKEDGLDPYCQAQADKLADNALDPVAAHEDDVVVQLQTVGQAQWAAPGAQGMSPGSLKGFVGKDLMVEVPRDIIEGVEDKDLLSACQIAAGPVGSVQAEAGRGTWVRIVGLGIGWRSGVCRQACSAQNPGDGGAAGQWTHLPPLELVAHRFGPDQSNRDLFQNAA
jgi:hypothetical protein